MSELVEKVARAIWNDETSGEPFPPDDSLHAGSARIGARAAIKAVAEWLKEDLGTEFCATGERLHIKLLAQMEAKS